MLSRLLGALAPTTEEVPFKDLSEEEQQEVLAKEKADRIEWHRRNVRNGPANFTIVTEGRQKSRARRAKAAHQRRVNRRHRRKFIAGQQDRAVLRGQLQALGALPYATDFEPSPQARVEAGQWVLRTFGERDEGGALFLHDDAFGEAVKAALAAYTGKAAA